MITISALHLEQWLGEIAWPLCRVLALFSVAPILHHRSIPMRYKVAASIAIAALATTQIAVPPPPIWSQHTPEILARQILIGLTIGFSMRIVFAAAELAGDLIGLQMGLSFASFIDPQNGTQMPLVGSLLGILASLLFLSMNGHLLMIEAVLESFRAFPVVDAAPAESVAPVRVHRLLGMGADLFRVGLHLSLPLLASMLILNIALGVLSRAAPQLGLFSVGFPVTLCAGLLLLMLSVPYITPFLQSALVAAMRF